MSKPALFGLLFGWLVILTFLVNSIVEYDALSGLVVTNPIGAFSSSDSNIFDLLRTFWNALVFNITGLPVLVNLFFQIPVAIIGYMLIGFIRGGS